ncbi:MAG: amidohydrolase [Chloroflexota bacterium]
MKNRFALILGVLFLVLGVACTPEARIPATLSQPLEPTLPVIVTETSLPKNEATIQSPQLATSLPAVKSSALSDSKADLVLKNGFIYTVDKKRSNVQAMAVKGDTIVYVGDDAGLSAFTGEQTKVIDLAGKMVLPAFVDSHAHANGGVSPVYEVVLNNLESADAYQQAIVAFLEKNPGLQGLKGAGWMDPLFPPEGPSKDILDKIAPDIPVILDSVDGHSVWVNSKTLQMAGITKDTPDPEGGRIEHDASGNPSGALREAATDLVAEVLPPYTPEQIIEGLKYYQKMAHSFGITTAFIPGIGIDWNDLEALRQFEKSGEMKMRLPMALKTDPKDNDPALIEKFIAARQENQNGLLKINAVKIFMDGVIESYTAYLEQPYANKPDYQGELLWDPQKLNKTCAALDKAGFQIHVHAIGDAASRVTLDCLAYARQQNGARDARHAITHLQLVSENDIKRFAELGVVAVPDPYWFAIDDFYTQAIESLGQERADRQYPMKSFFDQGVVVASASDYPVTIPPNPLNGIEKGVTRALSDTPDDVLVPAERVSVEDMIASFTINGAYANFMEKEIGSLEVGKKADMIVLDKNILQLPLSEIHLAQVVQTYFDGQEVFQSE